MIRVEGDRDYYGLYVFDPDDLQALIDVVPRDRWSDWGYIQEDDVPIGTWIMMTTSDFLLVKMALHEILKDL